MTDKAILRDPCIMTIDPDPNRQERCRSAGFRIGLASLIWAALILVSPQAGADTVVLLGDAELVGRLSRRLDGQITQESPTEIVLKPTASNSRPVTIPLDQIQLITYSGEPLGMRTARSRESAGQLERAAEAYAEVAAEAENPLVVQQARFGQLRCQARLALAGTGKIAEVEGELSDFLTQFRQSRHLVEGLELVVQLRLAQENGLEAKQAIGQLARIPGTEAQVILLDAQVLAGQGDHRQAIDRLDGLIADAAISEPIRRQARLARGVSLAASGQIEQAETAIREIIAQLSPEDAINQAVAYNTLGDCQRAANLPKEAVLAYLHTDILYAQNQSEHAEALARLVELWRQLGQDDRAESTLQQLRDQYPGSPWINRVSKSARP